MTTSLEISKKEVQIDHLAERAKKEKKKLRRVKYIALLSTFAERAKKRRQGAQLTDQ